MNNKMSLEDVVWSSTPPKEHNPEQSENTVSVEVEGETYTEALEKITLNQESYEDLKDELIFQKTFYEGMLSQVNEDESIKSEEEVQESIETVKKVVEVLDYQLALLNDPKTKDWYRDLAYKAVEDKIGKENIIMLAKALDALQDATEESLNAFDELKEYLTNNTRLYFPELENDDSITLEGSKHTLN